jgi:hypothetical protein
MPNDIVTSFCFLCCSRLAGGLLPDWVPALLHHADYWGGPTYDAPPVRGRAEPPRELPQHS